MILYSSILFVSILIAIFVPPIPTGEARFVPVQFQLVNDKPNYARCTHHAGLNPAVFALRSAIIWQTDADYQLIRTQFLDERDFDPNLARVDPAWSNYDLLKRSPFSLSTFGVELMNAAILNYRYIEHDTPHVVTSRTWVFCIDSKRVRSTQTTMQSFINGGRSEFDAE